MKTNCFLLFVFSIFLFLPTSGLAILAPANPAASGLSTATASVSSGIDSGLALYLPFDGTLIDASGSGNDGTAHGGLAFTADRFGRPSKACLFDGIDSYVSIPNSASLNPVDQLTISFWVRVDSVITNYTPILMKGTSLTYDWSNREYYIELKDNYTTPYFLIYAAGDGSGQHEVDTYGRPLHEWVLITGVYDRRNHLMTAYVNGILDQQVYDSYSTFNINEAQVTIGWAFEYPMGEKSAFKGALDDVRIYTRALSAEEVFALYSGPRITLTVTPDNHRLHLGWTSTLDSVPLRYRVYRGTTASSFELRDSVAGSVQSFTDVDLPNGVRYFYTVAAVDSNLKETEVSNVSSGIPHGVPGSVTTLRKVGGPIYAGLSLLGDSTLYAIAAGDAIYRMNINGILDFTLQVGGSVLSSTSISGDSVVYVASTDRNVYAFSATGAPVWSALPLGGELSSTPTIDQAGDRIYLGVANRNFFAVDRTAGKVAWNLLTDAPIRSSAVLTTDQMLVFSTVVGTIYALDLNNFNGSAPNKYTYTSGDSIVASPSLDTQGGVYFATVHGRRLKVSVAPGTGISPAWEIQNGPPVQASSVIDGRGTLYLASLDSTVYAIDTATGGIKWSYRTSAAIRSTPAISPSGSVYVGNDAGELTALDPTGGQLWYYSGNESIVAPLLYNNGTLYVGTVGGSILAVRDPSSLTNRSAGNSAPAWGTFQGNNRRTGNQADAPTLSVRDGSSGVPEAYELCQNYPNPFNPTTSIRYSIPVGTYGRTSLHVYDLLGREVAVLVDERKAAGSYEVRFNASGLSSGMYFYRLSAGDFVATKRLMLLK